VAAGGQTQLSPVCAYVAERTGTSLSPQQVSRLRELLSTRLGKRAEQEYVEFLKSVAGERELADLMAAISVHKTDLFRDEIQLQAFRNHVLDPLVQRAKNRPLRFWSAGCATGEEVATLLILLEEAGADPGSTVLGTDISEAAVEQAKRLSFHSLMFERVPEKTREKYFVAQGKELKLRSPLRERAMFQRHNLMDAPYPQPGPNGKFDVIFCRNVLIYFTPAAFERTVQGFAERLDSQGTLVLSSAEPLLKPQAGLRTLRCEQAFFYRLDGSPAPAPAPLSPSAQAWAPAISATPSHAALRIASPVTTVVKPPVAIPASKPPPVAQESDPHEQAVSLFTSALEEASQGAPDEKTETQLRHCLYLDPHLAQARYLLATLLEQKGQREEAANEYRRALAALSEGKARATGFFLNNERLTQACRKALGRVAP
jgi:chemotaxis protein methyltransferase CheR